uniref:Mediator of RNA polymerase II transcription subunit 13 n=1 Tax=Ananas comosus var. bracteatus TaxID=296719 RepID=A0A6V7PUI4_ANACO|nr:unnamed protein product [Ananas comosus var. bracteatus]
MLYSRSEGHRQILTKELEAVGLRLNKRPPQAILQTHSSLKRSDEEIALLDTYASIKSNLGDLQTVSWFQFVPFESDANALSEKSTWTNSFVGPWDPSQGAHNPGEKIKLWLFLPGRHSSVVKHAQAAVSRLRVVGTGLWLAPGDSEEVSVALSQALRNSIESALKGLSYVRFGDVFSRCNPLTKSKKIFRRAQPTFEFIFAATEKAIYVHVVISAKYIRGLDGDDIERILIHSSSHSIGEGLPVIVAPNGMLGRLTGCCPSDLVKQVHINIISKLKPSQGSTSGVPYNAQSSSSQLRGQNCYVEVALGCPSPSTDTVSELHNNQNNKAMHNTEDSQLMAAGGQRKQGSNNQFPVLEGTFIYPAEAVIVPMMHRALARISSKRLWVQNWMETSLSESWPLWNFPDSSFFEHC